MANKCEEAGFAETLEYRNVSDKVKDFIRSEISLALTHDRARLVEEVEKAIEEEAAEWGADKQGAIAALRHLREKVRSLLKDKGVK